MAKYGKFEQGTPPPGYVDNEVIRISRDGVWLANGQEISHEPTRRLFAKSLKKDETGYFLHIGHEMKRIEVEDTAYFVVRLFGNPKTGYELIINDESREKLDPSSLSYQPGRLTCRIQGGEEEAKFLSTPYMELLRDLEEDSDGYFIVIEGKRIRLDGK